MTPEESIRQFFDQLQEQRNIIPNVLDVTYQRIRRYHNVSAEDAERCLSWMIDNRLIPHFADPMRYAEWELTSKKGRIQWMANLLRKTSGYIMIRQAVEACHCAPPPSRNRKAPATSTSPAETAIPSSPAKVWAKPEEAANAPELRDPVTGTRLYADPYEGILMPIPGGEGDFATKGYELGWDEADE